MGPGFQYEFSYREEEGNRLHEEILLYRVEHSHEPEHQTQEASCNERTSNSHD
jgi:hypothetical protein